MIELHDCEGEEININEESFEEEFDDEPEPPTSSAAADARNPEQPEAQEPQQGLLEHIVAENEKNDGKFLDELQNLMQKYDGKTSLVFEPSMIKIKQSCKEARDRLKKKYR